jgi:hypothetical protein
MLKIFQKINNNDTELINIYQGYFSPNFKVFYKEYYNLLLNEIIETKKKSLFIIRQTGKLRKMFNNYHKLNTDNRLNIIYQQLNTGPIQNYKQLKISVPNSPTDNVIQYLQLTNNVNVKQYLQNGNNLQNDNNVKEYLRLLNTKEVKNYIELQKLKNTRESNDEIQLYNLTLLRQVYEQLLI